MGNFRPHLKLSLAAVSRMLRGRVRALLQTMPRWRPVGQRPVRRTRQPDAPPEVAGP